MHHRPSRPPLSARLAGVLTRLFLLVRGRLGRLAGAALLTTTVVGLVLAIPVVSGAGSSAPVTLDAASSSAPDDDASSPVVMGLDGRPGASSSSEGAPTTEATPGRSDSTPAEDSPTVAAAPDTTSSTPATSPTTQDPTTTAPGTSMSSSSSSSSSATPPSSTPPSAAPATQPPAGTPGAPTPPAEPEPEPTVEPAHLTDAAAEAFSLVNAARTDAGCGVLAADGALTTAAETHSAQMSASGLLGLDGLIGAVAQGRPNAQSAVSGWLNDSAAGGALLDCSRTSAGVGVVDGWWTFLVA